MNAATEQLTVYPLSFSQEQLWFLQSYDPELRAYNLPRVFRLRGPLDVDALNRAFQALIDRHASLRTRFFERDGVPVQSVEPDVAFDLGWEDLTSLSSEERESTVIASVAAITRHLFDLSRAPLLEAKIIRLAPEEHLLVCCLHHIVSDAWSNGIIVRDLAEAYRTALRQPGLIHLQALSAQYTEHALRQREQLASGALANELKYWNDHLGPDVPALELPTDRARPSQQTFNGAAERFALDASLVSKLRAFCRVERCTPFVVLLAAWQALLSRYCDQEDFAVGVPNAGRRRAELHDLVGFFVTTQVIRARLKPWMTLRQICWQARAHALAALQHDSVPLEALLSTRKSPRDAARSPLFQTLFDLRVTDDSERFELEGLAIERVESETSHAKFDLSLEVAISDQQAAGRIEFNTDILDAATVKRLAVFYRRLVEAMVTQPEQRLADVALLAPADTPRFDVRPSIRRSEQPAHAIHHLIEEQVHRHPDAIALVFGDEKLTYAALNAKANRLAHRLIALGVRPDNRVGIAAERGIDLVVGVLAILKAGAGYVPLDPAYPAERLMHMMSDSGITLLLTRTSVSDRLPSVDGIHTMSVDTLDLSNESDQNPGVPLHPDSLAYVIYTSGSTGKPKGAQLCHRNVSRLLQSTQDWFHFDATDVWTLFHSCAFDFSVWELFGALCYGGKLVIVPYEVSRTPEDFLTLLRREQVTVLNQTPSAFRQLMQVPALYQADDLALRAVIFGGEALDPQTLRPWLDHFGDERPRLINMYGITETTVHVTYRPILKQDLRTSRSPIGASIPDLGMRILDSNLNAVPAGVAGELYVSGEGLCRGYLKRAALTAGRFIADPGSENGERLYRTGDRARWSEAGGLEYLGRVDEQVKIRGFRIEPGEIEAELLNQRGVREAAVLAREGPSGTRLVAYVVPEPADDIDASVIREGLSRVLPDYMVPAAIVMLEALPLSANGKLDRKALPEPEYAGVARYEAPRGEVERALAAVWSEVLGIEQIGRHDNFFALGGDSILSLRVVAKARSRSISLSPKLMFRFQTPTELARAVSAEDVDTRSVPTIPVADRSAPLVLSPAQSRQWFLWQLDQDSTAYHITAGLRLDGGLNVAALKEAFSGLVARHESLRTVFRTSGEAGVEQVVLPTGDCDWVEPVAAEMSRDVAETKAAELARHIARKPFDLTTGPLFRVGLIRLSAREHILVLVLHHIVSDGWSMQLITDELVERYRARLDGRPPTLIPLPIQYADYSVWQTAWLKAGEQERELNYWRATLGDEHPLLRLPTDHPRPAQPRYRAGRHHFELSVHLTEKLRERAREHHATLFMVLLAGFQALLHRYTGQSDIRIGATNANRHRPETQGVVGFFVNTQVLRTEIGGRMTLAMLLDQVRETVVGAQEHQDLPFEQLVEALQPERDGSHQPLFQVLLDHQRENGARLKQFSGLSLQRYELGEQGALFELWMNTVEQRDGRIGARLSYARELFEPETIARLGKHYLLLLSAIADRSEQRVSDVPLLSEIELQRLREWEHNSRRYPSLEFVHRLIERQVRERPTAIALALGDTELSYQTLNVRSNRLAHRLITLGVGPEVRVGVAAERSVEMVVALLAVMKAGGAYVPLDPELPAERLGYMMRDSGLALLLTQKHLRERLPAVQTMLVLDELDVSAESGRDPEVSLHPENLAYVIYTSGSTGQPKGAANRHISLSNRLVWMQEAYGLQAGETVLQKTSFGFDVSVWEFFWPLMQGARLALAPPGAHRNVQKLVELIRHHEVSTLHFVPSLLQVFLAHEGIEACTSLRRIVCSGEALPPEAQDKVFARLPWATLYNLYGPTEAAIDVTHWTCVADGRRSVPIGRPIADTRVVVLDAELNPVPPGVAGELYLGGIGLARGYLRPPALTAGRFVADPDSSSGERLYRTGDLVRWSTEGQLEYLGRIDHQVKIRGFRIELGEIESQLRSQPQVSDAVVIAKEHEGDKRLLAYVVPNMQALGAEPGGSRDELVTQWESVFDSTYEGDRAAPGFRGWNSSYTDQPIPEVAMREWLDGTVARIRALEPDRILEIGCGVGLLVEQLAPRATAYVGTDVSARAVNDLRSWARTQPSLAHVQLRHVEATDFTGVRPGEFDTVVLNSVAQYLPDVDYLLEVLQGAARAVGPRGNLFIGDLRHLAHIPMFHASVQLARASAQTTMRQLKSRIARAVALDKELVFDPAFFHALTPHLGMSSIEVLLRRGHSDNELTRYRYDVVMRGAELESPAPDVFDGSRPDALGWLSAQLAASRPSTITLRRVPNKRLARDLAAWWLIRSSEERATAGEVLSQLDRQTFDGVDPEALWALGETHGYQVQIGWTPGASDGSFDAHFIERTSLVTRIPSIQPSGVLPADWRALASDPVRALAMQKLGGRLREHLLRSLPDYMVPAHFTVLDKLPLNANGKLDRKALPEPEHVNTGRYEAPHGEMEVALAGIWSEVLGAGRISRQDNFFEIGGHSLALIQVRSLLAQRHGFELPVQAFFDHRTLALLAEAVSRSGEQRAENSKELRLAKMRGLIRELEVDSDAG